MWKKFRCDEFGLEDPDKNLVKNIDKIFGENKIMKHIRNISVVIFGLGGQLVNFGFETTLMMFDLFDISPNIMPATRKKLNFIISMSRVLSTITINMYELDKKVKQINPKSTFMTELLSIKLEGDFNKFEEELDRVFRKETYGYIANDYINLLLIFYDFLEEKKYKGVKNKKTSIIENNKTMIKFFTGRDYTNTKNMLGKDIKALILKGVEFDITINGQNLFSMNTDISTINDNTTYTIKYRPKSYTEVVDNRIPYDTIMKGNKVKQVITKAKSGQDIYKKYKVLMTYNDIDIKFNNLYDASNINPMWILAYHINSTNVDNNKDYKVKIFIDNDAVLTLKSKYGGIPKDLYQQMDIARNKTISKDIDRDIMKVVNDIDISTITRKLNKLYTECFDNDSFKIPQYNNKEIDYILQVLNGSMRDTTVNAQRNVRPNNVQNVRTLFRYLDTKRNDVNKHKKYFMTYRSYNDAKTNINTSITNYKNDILTKMNPDKQLQKVYENYYMDKDVELSRKVNSGVLIGILYSLYPVNKGILSLFGRKFVNLIYNPDYMSQVFDEFVGIIGGFLLGRSYLEKHELDTYKKEKPVEDNKTEDESLIDDMIDMANKNITQKQSQEKKDDFNIFADVIDFETEINKQKQMLSKIKAGGYEAIYTGGSIEKKEKKIIDRREKAYKKELLRMENELKTDKYKNDKFYRGLYEGMIGRTAYEINMNDKIKYKIHKLICQLVQTNKKNTFVITQSLTSILSIYYIIHKLSSICFASLSKNRKLNTSIGSLESNVNKFKLHTTPNMIRNTDIMFPQSSLMK